MKPFIAAILAASLVTGCRFGPKIEEFQLARVPRGALAQVSRTSGQLNNGELLAVDSVGLVILEGRRMVSVPFVEIREARFPEMGGGYTFGRGKPPSPEAVAMLRRISQFPQGITPEIQARLSAIYVR